MTQRLSFVTLCVAVAILSPYVAEAQTTDPSVIQRTDISPGSARRPGEVAVGAAIGNYDPPHQYGDRETQPTIVGTVEVTLTELSSIRAEAQRSWGSRHGSSTALTVAFVRVMNGSPDAVFIYAAGGGGFRRKQAERDMVGEVFGGLGLELRFDRLGINAELQGHIVSGLFAPALHVGCKVYF